MQTTEEERLTPEIISKSNDIYSIPIYQRLFEWSKENIETLLSDLKNSCNEEREDYYIGMLTSTINNNELVDGQQRFVVMILLGKVLSTFFENWENFILCRNNELRIRFESRPKDNDILKAIVEKKEREDDKNGGEKQELSMLEMGVECISSYIKENFKDVCERKKFAEYVFKHLVFFIAKLPENYSPKDMNLYFERMNTTGKNLEQHEILKVKLLRHLGDSKEKYMRLWNSLSDVDTILLKKDSENEDEEKYRRRKNNALNKKPLEFVDEYLKNRVNIDDVDGRWPTIEEIEPQKQKSSKGCTNTKRGESLDSYGPLKFSDLLLLVLYWYKIDKREQYKQDFFNTSNLLETFSRYFHYDDPAKVVREDIEEFMERLLKCRIILDLCFIRLKDDKYSLDMNLPDGEESKNKKRVMMYESMLYVSSSDSTHYRWFCSLMDYAYKLQEVPNAEELLCHLKREDDKAHKFPERYGSLMNEEFLYPKINRYWFWKLDYLLWENRESIFSSYDDNVNKIVEEYVFRRNRSIEHTVPQTPADNIQWEDSGCKEPDKDIDKDKIGSVAEKLGKIVESFSPNDSGEFSEDDLNKWNVFWNEFNLDEKKIADRIIRDSIGNLSMISAGLNSSLRNSPYNTKKDYVKLYCDGEKGRSGTIESLNLLWIYCKYETWNDKYFRLHILYHGKEMQEILKNNKYEKG